MGSVDQCGRGMDGFPFCVSSGWGKFMKTRHGHRVGSQTVTCNSVTGCTQEKEGSYFSLPVVLSPLLQKKIEILKYGRVKVLDERNWSTESKNHGKDWQKYMFSGVWVSMWNGVAGSPEEFLGDLASCGPSDRTFSLELGGAQGTRTQGCANTLLQGIPPVQFLNVILEPIKHASFPQLGFFTSYKKINK